MAMVNPIIQVVGYQNSGKTTLVSKLVADFSKQGIAVAVLKHHGHGGAPEASDCKKDSEKHFRSGAIVSAVEGNGILQLSAQKRTSLALNLSLLQSFQPDLILIEGYKNESYPKIVIVRHHRDLALIEQLDAIIAVVYWPEIEAEMNVNYAEYTIFKLADNQLSQWLREKIALK